MRIVNDGSPAPTFWSFEVTMSNYSSLIVKLRRMKECDIFGGSKHTLTPPTYLQGVTTPNPQDLRPWLQGITIHWPVPNYTAWWQRHMTLTCPGLHSIAERPGFELASYWSQLQRSNHSATMLLMRRSWRHGVMTPTPPPDLRPWAWYVAFRIWDHSAAALAASGSCLIPCPAGPGNSLVANSLADKDGEHLISLLV